MASLPIWWIVARAYCQVTEDEDKVAQALDAATAGGMVSHDTVEGQFGNPVIVFVRRIQRAEDLRATWDRWRAAGLLASLRQELDARLDQEGVLHFRIDKQSALGGVLALAGRADPIDVQVKLKAYPAKPEEVRRVARTLLEEAA